MQLFFNLKSKSSTGHNQLRDQLDYITNYCEYDFNKLMKLNVVTLILLEYFLIL